MDKWQFYAGDALIQIEFAKRSWEGFLEAEKLEGVIPIFMHLQHFLSHAAIVDKILDRSSNKFRNAILTGHIDLKGIDLKPFRRLRNHLEHFDERLDKWVREYHGHPFFDMNLVTGTTGFPKEAFLRALDGHVFKFYGEDYDLDLLYKSLLSIEQRLPRHDW